MIYFKPLRRKAGVVTLVMASAMAVGWIRSREMIDSLGVSVGVRTPLAYLLVSHREGIIWQRMAIPESAPIPPLEIAKRIQFHSFPFNPLFHYYSDQPEWHFDRLGIRIGKLQTDEGVPPLTERVTWVIPYWLIIMPLTLLAAWLLLSTSRLKKLPTGPTLF